MSLFDASELRKCPFCGYIMGRPYPKICPNPTCLKEIGDISQDSFAENIKAKIAQDQIKKMYQPTDLLIETERPKDIQQIKVSTATAAGTIKGVKKKDTTGIAEIKKDVVVIPAFGQYFKNIGIVTEDREPIYNKNDDYTYLLELSINLDAIASRILGGEIDRLLLLSDISNASEKVLYIKKRGLIYFLYGQFPDKQGYYILNNLRTELNSSLKQRKITELSPVELHQLKLRFPAKANHILEQYTQNASEIMTDKQIPSVVQYLRIDYFGMSYQSIGTISVLFGDELLDLELGEDEKAAIDLKESSITAMIEAIAANTIANTKATPQYLTVKLGFEKYRYLLFEKLGNEYFVYMLAEGNLEKYPTVAEIIKEMVQSYTHKPFRGDLKPFIELRKKITEFFQIRTF